MTKSDAQASPARRGYSRSKDTRAKILEAALVEASEVGFHKTSLARIAMRAGVAIGNLNYHFGSKRELMRELMGTLMTELIERLQGAGPAGAGHFFEREEAGMRVYLEYLRDKPAYVQLADEIKLHEPELYRAGMRAWLDAYGRRIRESVERGELRPMDEAEQRALAHFLLGTRQHLHLMIESPEGDPYPGDDAVIAAYLKLVRQGLSA